MARKKFTQKQIDILYECWKSVTSNKERIKLIEEKLPTIPPLSALNKMRSLAKSDPKWIGMITRKKNQKEKEKENQQQIKEQKIKEREKKKKDQEQRKISREQKKQELEDKRKNKTLKTKIRSVLKTSDVSLVEEKIEPKIFFCLGVQQFMNNISCIFRKFSDDISFAVGPCEKCTRMDEYIPILQEVLKNAKQKGPKRDKAGAKCGQVEEEKSCTDASENKGETTSNTKRKGRKPKH